MLYPSNSNPAPTTTYQMKSGYAFELPQAHDPDPSRPYDWRKARNDAWDIVVYTPDGTEVAQGERIINGGRRTVFLCADGVYRAQLTHVVRGG